MVGSNGPYTTAYAIQDWVAETPMVPVKPYNTTSEKYSVRRVQKIKAV